MADAGNLLTEDEAKTKWCPLVRLVGYKDSDAEGTSWNRAPDDPLGIKTPAAKCIASACMAWRKVDQTGVGPNGEKRDRDLDGRTRWVNRGYCGAFGNPLPSADRRSV